MTKKKSVDPEQQRRQQNEERLRKMYRARVMYADDEPLELNRIINAALDYCTAEDLAYALADALAAGMSDNSLAEVVELTGERSEEYLSRGGTGCPFCGPDVPVVSQVRETAEEGTSRHCVCPCCQRDWVKVYLLQEVHPD